MGRHPSSRRGTEVKSDTSLLSECTGVGPSSYGRGEVVEEGLSVSAGTPLPVTPLEGTRTAPIFGWGGPGERRTWKEKGLVEGRKYVCLDRRYKG